MFHIFDGMGSVAIKADGSFLPGSAQLDPRARSVSKRLCARPHDDRQIRGFQGTGDAGFLRGSAVWLPPAANSPVAASGIRRISRNEDMPALRARSPGFQDLHYFRSNKRLFFFDGAHVQAIAGNGEGNKDHLALVFAKTHASVYELLDL